MAALIALVVFAGVPLWLGIRPRSHWSLLFPLTLFGLAVWSYATLEPSGDEVDAIAGVMVVFATASIVLGFVGVLIGRRAQQSRERAD
jgi:hypothetical protein